MEHNQHFVYVRESEGVEEYRLVDNGLQVLLYEQRAAPVVTLMVTYRVGSRNESAGLTGATHFLEHLMFKGTDKFNKRHNTSVFNVLQKVGAQVNATTWFDRTNYYELLPREHLGLAMEIEADRMRGALLEPADVESERTVILNEFDRGENEPVRKLFYAVWSIAYVAHPYHHPTIGWRSDIEQVTGDGLRHFYDTYYWPNNATLSIIGDIDKEDVLEQVYRHYGSIPSSTGEVPIVTTREPEQNGERRVTVRQAGQLGSLMVAYKSPPARHPDADTLDVLSIILASGKQSRLFAQLTDKGLTSHVFSSNTSLYDPGLFYAFAYLAPGQDHQKIEQIMYGTFDEIRLNGVTAEELALAKSKLKAQQAFGRDGSFAVASQLNEAIASGDWTLYTTFLDRIEAISQDDVVRVARQYLVPEQSTVGYYIPII